MILKPNCIFRNSAILLTKIQPVLYLRVRCLLLNKGVVARNETLEYMQTVVLEVLSQSRHKRSLAPGCSASVPLSPLLHSWAALEEKDTRNSNSMFLCMSKYTEQKALKSNVRVKS